MGNAYCIHILLKRRMQCMDEPLNVKVLYRRDLFACILYGLRHIQDIFVIDVIISVARVRITLPQQ